jgi:nicotinamidase-related amidase
MSQPRVGFWDASDCALLLIDYQQTVLDLVFEQDRRMVELNARTLAKFAKAIDIPIVFSTWAVEMGIGKPMLPSITAAVPNVKPIDRSNMNAWEDPKFLEAVRATGRKRLVMGGIVTSNALAVAAVSALADGYEVMFIEDAVADAAKEHHDMAVLRLVQAGAVPNTTITMTAEWFRDLKSPYADVAGKLWVPYKEEWAALKRTPKLIEPHGMV